MSLSQSRPQDGFRTLLQYQEIACFNKNCAVIGTPDSPLKSCSRCKRVKYCQISCQKADYPVHKSFCQAFSALRQNSPPVYSIPRLGNYTADVSPIGPVQRNMLMGTLTDEMHHLIQISGKKNMGKIANYLLYLEPRCLWCYRTKAHLAAENSASTQLLNCSHCLAATYCCSDHQEKANAVHTLQIGEGGLTQCDIFKMCTQDDNFMQSWSARPDKPGEVVHWAPDRVLPDDNSMPKLPRSWDAYFASTECPYVNMPPLLRTMVSISLSMPLTILDALQRFSVEPSSIGSKLVIHVLGAQMDFEMKYGGMAFEEIMHQLPWVKELVVEFVGPETGAMDASKISMPTCPACSHAGKARTYGMSNSFYHDYASRRSYTTPTIVVAFNSGLHESPDQWRSTIQLLAKKNLPCVFTSYNIGEASEDTRYLEEMGARVVWRGEQNKWSGQKPHFDYFTEGLFWYENAFALGFQGST